MNDNRHIASASAVLTPQSRVVFTGIITVAGQPMFDPTELDALCRQHGLIYESRPTLDTTALIAEDISTESRFAQLADLYDLPVVSGKDFSEWIATAQSPSVRSHTEIASSDAVDSSSSDASEPAEQSAGEHTTSEEQNAVASTVGETGVDEDDWEELDAAIAAYDRGVDAGSSGQPMWRIARKEVHLSRGASAQALVLQGKDFTGDIVESYPADIVSGRRAAITTSEDELLLALIDNPGSLPVSRKTVKGQGQKTLWALALGIVFFILFGINTGQFLGNIFLVLFLAHVLLMGYHLLQMLIRLMGGPLHDIAGTRERLGLVLDSPLKKAPVLYTNERPLDEEEYSLVAQLCGFYNFLQDEASPIPGDKWLEVVDETLLAVHFARQGDADKTMEVAETINLWLDEAAADPLSPEEFSVRGIELMKAG